MLDRRWKLPSNIHDQKPNVINQCAKVCKSWHTKVSHLLHLCEEHEPEPHEWPMSTTMKELRVFQMPWTSSNIELSKLPLYCKTIVVCAIFLYAGHSLRNILLHEGKYEIHYKGQLRGEHYRMLIWAIWWHNHLALEKAILDLFMDIVNDVNMVHWMVGKVQGRSINNFTQAVNACVCFIGHNNQGNLEPKPSFNV